MNTDIYKPKLGDFVVHRVAKYLNEQHEEYTHQLSEHPAFLHITLTWFVISEIKKGRWETVYHSIDDVVVTRRVFPNVRAAIHDLALPELIEKHLVAHLSLCLGEMTINVGSIIRSRHEFDLEQLNHMWILTS